MISSIRKQASWLNWLTIMTSSWAPCVPSDRLFRETEQNIHYDGRMVFVLLLSAAWYWLGTLMDGVGDGVEQDAIFL